MKKPKGAQKGLIDMTKLELVKANVQLYIEMREKEIADLEKDIKESVENYDAYRMATFLPGKLQALQKAMDELKLYRNQMDALEYIDGVEA